MPAAAAHSRGRAFCRPRTLCHANRAINLLRMLRPTVDRDLVIEHRKHINKQQRCTHCNGSGTSSPVQRKMLQGSQRRQPAGHKVGEAALVVGSAGRTYVAGHEQHQLGQAARQAGGPDLHADLQHQRNMC